MNGYKISEAANRTGFSESALRFYEQQGVVVPERTSSGYRSYNAEDIESLQFLARAKRLGLTLDEISELLLLLDDDECRPVQDRMRALVTERIDETQAKIGDLIAFTGQLQRAAARLGPHTPDGGCDDDCGCKSDSPAVTTRTLIPLGASQDISCSIEPGQAVERIEDWKALLAQAVGRQPIPSGIRISFTRDVDIAGLSQLAASEQTCCQFFNFTIGIASDTVSLDVTGPGDAQPVIASIFGVAA
ncbi:MAG TPA: MerR family transcriptional regulator [Acidimicrobiia bacterium]